VLEAEYQALYGEPALDASAPTEPNARLRALHARIHKRGPTALTLSGGGIRSATFGLGVLQGLAHVGVLGTLDYLSTVSGGGYIGGWLTAWLHRQGPEGRARVLASADPGRRTIVSTVDDNVADTSPIDRVRQTCRYLAPSGGVVSADVWTLATTLARNLVLNWFVILPIIAAALMVPRIYYGGIHAVERGFTSGPCSTPGDAASISFMIMIASFAISTAYIIVNLVGFGARWSQTRFLAWCLLPSVAGSVAATFFWSAYPCEVQATRAIIPAAVIPVVGWAVLGVVARLVHGAGRSGGGTLRVKVGPTTILAALASGPIIGAGAWWFGSFEYGFGGGEMLRELYATFAVPAVIAIVLLQTTAFIGLASSEFDDAVLEWWNRCGAWLGIAAAVWMVSGVLVFYMADLVEMLVTRMDHALSMGHSATSVMFATLIPLLSSLTGLAARAGGQKGEPSLGRKAFQMLALPATIVVLLATIAWVDLRVSGALEYHFLNALTRCTPDAAAPCHPLGAGIGENMILALALFGFGIVMSWFVPVNRFSLHGMYRQRLIRTFLGASRPDRHPNAFTGFDASDDVCVHHLRDVRPLHVINTTLNAVSSTHLGRHETLAQSFSFTPLYVGNQDLGYRPAEEYGSDGGGKATGLSLGMALAVSGAAASPAMGMYSTKSRAFLLTLANARLGLWFGNPRSAKRWQSSEPRVSVDPLMRELLGLTTDHNPFVYLSDGGHYENLGLWEMVARRCRIIVVSDAGSDPGYTFDDLANAVRRIRLDLGVPIIFPPIDITKQGQGAGNPHAAIGRIRYAVVDGAEAPDGIIVYIKATLSGDEPVDVKNFAASDPAFPHDSTANQFFDEARFESYRMLGFHSVLAITGERRNLANATALSEAVRESLETPKREKGDSPH
jgi:hypothetical protein